MIQENGRRFGSIKDWLPSSRSGIARSALLLAVICVSPIVGMWVGQKNGELRRIALDAQNQAKSEAAQARRDFLLRAFEDSGGVNLIREANLYRVDVNESAEVAPPGYDPMLAAAQRITAETGRGITPPSFVPENSQTNPPRKAGIYISTLP